MNVKNTLKRCLLTYPAIFPNKWEVYHHWFIINGNGYEWVKGELISISEKEATNIAEGIEKQFEEYLSDKSLLDSARFSRAYCLKNIKVLLNYKENSKNFEIPESRNYRIYPICEYSQILNIPEDIKPDWKEAAQEMYEWLCIHYNKFKESDKKFINKIQL